MLKRSWVQALCAAVFVVALAGCGGSECESPADCRADKGNPPAGKEYTCEANKCGLRDVTVPEVKCDPECAATEFCDTSGSTGVCRTCSATQGCTAPMVCDVAANSGKGQCKTCTDSTATGTDSGCAAATPICDPAGANGMGVCKGCVDTASGNAADTGCTASAPLCDPAGNSGAGICKACSDTASGSAQDLGCTATSPVCDPAAASGVGACKTCTDTATGINQDLGCSAAAPICQTTASGGRGACRSCQDSTVGNGTDLGCVAATPLCDITAGGGAGTCKSCLDSAPGVSLDQGCAAASPICDPAGNSGAGACKNCVDSAAGAGTDTGCSANAPICDPAGSGGAGSCRVCLNSATGGGADVGCATGAPICDPAAGSGAGACKVCVDSAGPGSGTQDDGCFSPTAICDPTGSNGAGSCKVCVATEGCPGAQTCNAEGSACEGCVDNTSCAPTPSTPFCKTTTAPSICVECVVDGQCTNPSRPTCSASNFCGCASDAACDAAPGNTDFCDLTANNTRGECKVCLTDANCAQKTPGTPFCDNQTACIQCRQTSDCSLTQVCNANTKACEQVPGADPATTNQQIIDFKALPAPTTLSPPFVIENAFVTYIKPALGDPQAGDNAGFFIQAKFDGPAMFVVADPSTLQVGDRVTLSIGAKTPYSGGVQAATSISNLTIVSRGHPVQNLSTATPAGLALDVTNATDLVTNVEAYFGKILRMTGSLNSTVGAAGSGHQAFDIKTGGITVAPFPRMRLPSSFISQYELVNTCTFTTDVAVMWKFTSTANPPVTTAQPSAYSLADFAALSCPAPKPLSALAGSLTQVIVTFDRNIDPTTVLATGEQFSFDNGLTATAATVTGKQLTLTTSQQTAGTVYKLTVSNTVKDFLGGAVTSPNHQATFKGYRTPAVLRITEIQPSMPNGTDLVELVVVTGGVVDGMTLSQDLSPATLLATLPDATVAAGDVIVVHMNMPTQASETTSKTQFPQSTVASFYDTAWDFVGTGTVGITFSNRLIVIKDVVGTIQDAAAFARLDLATPPSAFPANLQALQAAGAWLPVDCGGVPCTYTTTPTAQAVAADWTALPSSNATNTSNTVRRVSATDTNTKDDWATGAHSWGVANP